MQNVHKISGSFTLGNVNVGDSLFRGLILLLIEDERALKGLVLSSVSSNMKDGNTY